MTDFAEPVPTGLDPEAARETGKQFVADYREIEKDISECNLPLDKHGNVIDVPDSNNTSLVPGWGIFSSRFDNVGENGASVTIDPVIGPFNGEYLTGHKGESVPDGIPKDTVCEITVSDPKWDARSHHYEPSPSETEESIYGTYYLSESGEIGRSIQLGAFSRYTHPDIRNDQKFLSGVHPMAVVPLTPAHYEALGVVLESAKKRMQEINAMPVPEEKDPSIVEHDWPEPDWTEE